MPRVDGVFDEVPEFELRRRAAAEVSVAELFERYRDVFAEAERAPRPMILVPRDRDVVSPADAGPELMWHGDAYVAVTPPPAPAPDLDAVLAELYRPVDPRVWATTPEPCTPEDDDGIRRAAAAAVARWHEPPPCPFEVLGATYRWPPANPAPSLLDGPTDLERLLFPGG